MQEVPPLICVLYIGVLELVYMKEEDGAVFQILEFNGKLLVSVNSQVRVTVCVCV